MLVEYFFASTEAVDLLGTGASKCTSGGFIYCVFTRTPSDVTVGDSGLCFCVCVTYFERLLTPLCEDFLELCGKG